MPCYNAADHLARSIGSIQAQTFGDWELIVVDDGSKDASWSVLNEIANSDPRVRPVQQANAGAAAARNRALAETRGRYTAFLDADDTWEPDFLETMVNALETHADAGLAYCGWQNLGVAAGRGEPFIPPDYENEYKIESLLGGCRWPIHGVLTRSHLIRDAGGFDEALSSCMDYDLWLRLGSAHRITLVPRVLAYYHHHGGEQITRNRVRMAVNHWRAQQKFLAAHPGVAAKIGETRIAELTVGELMRRGFVAYWERDLPAARTIFRLVMRHGHGKARDWLYMLPALLPERLHRFLLSRFESGPR